MSFKWYLFFINRIEYLQLSGPTGAGHWLQGCWLPRVCSRGRALFGGSGGSGPTGPSEDEAAQSPPVLLCTARGCRQSLPPALFLEPSSLPHRHKQSVPHKCYDANGDNDYVTITEPARVTHGSSLICSGAFVAFLQWSQSKSNGPFFFLASRQYANSVFFQHVLAFSDV